MYEKYNAFEVVFVSVLLIYLALFFILPCSLQIVKVGVGGGGGEYVPQKGFGWTNGVALYLLKDTSSADALQSDDDDMSQGMIVVVCIVAFLSLGILVFLARFMMKRAHNREKSSGEYDDNINILERPISSKNSVI